MSMTHRDIIAENIIVHLSPLTFNLVSLHGICMNLSRNSNRRLMQSVVPEVMALHNVVRVTSLRLHLCPFDEFNPQIQYTMIEPSFLIIEDHILCSTWTLR